MSELPCDAWAARDVMVVSPTPSHPQDHGNRRRVYEICRRLKRQGARVHFVYYAAEHDWREERPRHLERAMAGAWDAFDLVAPSVPLHRSPVARDHDIDEWADHALTDYVAWACRVHRYDAVLVNYTWMSFVFDSVPAGVFKILDTHDRFSGRRDVLEQLGIGAEFFHTTPEGEARALRRADLVWAIKDEERAMFRKVLDDDRLLTMPHAEDAPPLARRPAGDGWLRVGVLGARNSINRENLRLFLDEALPIIRAAAAPVKILIGGGCADDFADLRHSNIEIVGRVAHPRDFYARCDVVAIPIRASTGLKIRVAEALALGMPVVVHAHAMEGYPRLHPLHECTTMRQMAEHLVRLSFDPREIDVLAATSLVANGTIAVDVETALVETTRRMARATPSVCVVASLPSLQADGLVADGVYAMIDYLRELTAVTVFLTGRCERLAASVERQLRWTRRVIVGPDQAASLVTLPSDWRTLDFPSMLRTFGVTGVVLLSEVGLPPGGMGGLRVVARPDLVALSGGDAAQFADDVLARGAADAICASGWAVDGRARGLPSWRSVHRVRVSRIARTPLDAAVDSMREPTVCLLADVGDPLADMIAAAVDIMTGGIRLLRLTVCADPEMTRAIDTAFVRCPAHHMRALVMLAANTDAACALADAATDRGVPVLRLLRGIEAAAPTLGFSGDSRTVAGLLSALAFILGDTATARSRAGERPSSEVDAGWTWLWRTFSLPHRRSGGDCPTAFELRSSGQPPERRSSAVLR